MSSSADCCCPIQCPHGLPDVAISSGTLLVSEDTLYELAVVMSRPKLDKYMSLERRRQFFREVEEIASYVPIIQRVKTCRDPKDDKFLELAVNGRANLIVTGDSDLLALHPFRGTAIKSPADYLAAL